MASHTQSGGNTKAATSGSSGIRSRRHPARLGCAPTSCPVATHVHRPQCYPSPVTSRARSMTPEALEAAFQAVPPEQVAEILDGELIVSPRPSPRHTRTASRLGGRLRPFDDPEGNEPGRWLILDEPELHLGRDKAVPDLAGWRRERLPTMPETAAFEVVPDWVCEVVSPGTEHHDRGRKRRIYARAGVMYYWLIDPLDRTLEIYRLVNGHWHEVETFEGDMKVRPEPFDAIELDLSVLWAW